VGQSINVVVAKQLGQTIAVPQSVFGGGSEAPVTLQPVPTMTSISVITKLAQMTDVDASRASSGDVPVFDEDRGKYEVRQLEFEELADGEDLDGGNF